MFKKSEFLRKHGLWLKIGLIALFIVSLGGMNCIIFARDNMKEPDYLTHNKGLDDWNRSDKYVGSEFDDWKSRKEAASKELEIIFGKAKAKAENYTLVDYFQDFEKLMVLEDKYNFYLTFPKMLEPLLRLRDAKASWKRYEPNAEEQQYIVGMQQKIQQRDGLYSASSDFNLKEFGLNCLFRLIPKYLILMLFWILIYIIRFEEHDQARRRFQRHHHELGRFIDDEEPFPGRLSFYDEMLIAPWRFVMRVILWPKYCWNYPHYESPAQMLRFNRLKAEFLRYKPLGYQLTPREEAILLAKARKPVKDIERAVASLFQFPVLVKRSVYIGYLSLFFGVLLQPVISLAAGYSQKVDAHFYGQDQTMLVEQQNDTGPLIRDGTNISVQQHEQNFPDWQAVLPKPMDLQLVFDQLLKFIEKLKLKLPLLILDIDHVPLTRVVCAARC